MREAAYVRRHDGERLLVVLHFGAGARTADLSGEGASGEVLCATGMDREGVVDLGRLQLGPREGLVVRLA